MLIYLFCDGKTDDNLGQVNYYNEMNYYFRINKAQDTQLNLLLP